MPYGSATPPMPYVQTYTSAQAPCMPSHQQCLMPSTGSFTHEQPIHQSYQMPTTASFTYDQSAQSYSNQQQQYAAAQSFYAMPQHLSFSAYPQPSNYPSRGDTPQFQFFPFTAPGDDGPSNATGPMNHQFHPSAAPGAERPSKAARPMNHTPAEHPQSRPTEAPSRPVMWDSEVPVNQAGAGPGRAKSPMGRAKSPINKPNGSTWNKPPAKKASKKKQSCSACTCGV